jgi:hypothetical protein
MLKQVQHDIFLFIKVRFPLTIRGNDINIDASFRLYHSQASGCHSQPGHKIESREA